nr:uncharacterized protein LOC129267153 [Lytechinus pictus]
MVSGLLEDEIMKLIDNLELERDALSVCKGTKGEYKIVRLMEIWKGQHSSGPFHYRLKLALGIRAAGKTEVARKIIAGIGISDMVTVNPDVVKSICNGMGHGQLERLAEHLRLNAKGDNPVDSSALVIQWITEWFSKADSSSLLESIKGKIKDRFVDEVKSRREYIENLYKAGFIRLAEELMLLEVSRLRLTKQGQMTLSDEFVDEPCESKNQETPEQMESENNLPSGACSEDSSTGVQGTSCNNENEDT